MFKENIPLSSDGEQEENKEGNKEETFEKSVFADLELEPMAEEYHHGTKPKKQN